MKLQFIIGTRPEAIKIAPVVKAAIEASCEVEVCFTGQHEHLAQSTFEEFNLNVKTYTIYGTGDTLDRKMSNMMSFLWVTTKNKPDFVIVQGDTISAFSGALCAFHAQIPVVHIEAGLRTNNLESPFPEEAYRQMISRIASINFAPTEISKSNLEKENVSGKCYVVGNTSVDAVRMMSTSYPGEKNKILVTLHRRENHKRIASFFTTIKNLATDFPHINFVVTAHPNPEVRKVIHPGLSTWLDNLVIIEPLSYKETVNVLSQCKLVITDSGGLQEECSAINVPVAIMRDTTERMEVVDAGGAILLGDAINDSSLIFLELSKLIRNKTALIKMADAPCPFGDGETAIKIIEILKQQSNGSC